MCVYSHITTATILTFLPHDSGSGANYDLGSNAKGYESKAGVCEETQRERERERARARERERDRERERQTERGCVCAWTTSPLCV
jgi:hypothetical protein